MITTSKITLTLAAVQSAYPNVDIYEIYIQKQNLIQPALDVWINRMPPSGNIPLSRVAGYKSELINQPLDWYKNMPIEELKFSILELVKANVLVAQTVNDLTAQDVGVLKGEDLETFLRETGENRWSRSWDNQPIPSRGGIRSFYKEKTVAFLDDKIEGYASAIEEALKAELNGRNPFRQ